MAAASTSKPETVPAVRVLQRPVRFEPDPQMGAGHVSERSEFLSRWPEEDFIDVDVFRLAYGEVDQPSERLGRNADLADIVLGGKLIKLLGMWRLH